MVEKIVPRCSTERGWGPGPWDLMQIP